MAIKRGSKVDKSYSAASMTDLMFLLLIFMLISTTLINPNALKLMLPESSNQLKEKPYTTVSINSDLEYFINGDQKVEFSQLESALNRELADVSDPVISLHCDKSVAVDHVVQVMNIAKDNNYKLILATSPK
ncbi:MAG: biopolymer transporter ExbD [Rikenellaceae bacterium]